MLTARGYLPDDTPETTTIMKALDLLTLGQGPEGVLSLAGMASLLKNVYCLPVNLLIEFLSTREVLFQNIQWSQQDADAMYSSWAAICGSSVVWILIVAWIAGANKPSS